MEPFAETIRDADVTSIAGLRAKTLVAIWDYQPLSSRHEGNFELDNDDSHWSLFSGAVSVTGLSDMVNDLQTRLQIDASIPQEGESVIRITGIELHQGSGMWHGTASNGDKKYMWYYLPRVLLNFTEQEPSIPNCWMNVETPQGESPQTHDQCDQSFRCLLRL